MCSFFLLFLFSAICSLLMCLFMSVLALVVVLSLFCACVVFGVACCCRLPFRFL